MTESTAFIFVHGSAVTAPLQARDVDIFIAGGEWAARDADRERAAALGAAWAAARGVGHLPLDIHHIDAPRPTAATRAAGETKAREQFGMAPDAALYPTPRDGESDDARHARYAREREIERICADVAATGEWEIRVPVPPRDCFLATPLERPVVAWLSHRADAAAHPYAVVDGERKVSVVADVQWSIASVLRAGGGSINHIEELLRDPRTRRADMAVYLSPRPIDPSNDIDLDERGYFTGLTALRNAWRHVAPEVRAALPLRLGMLGRLITYVAEREPHPRGVEWVLSRCSGGAPRLYWSATLAEFWPRYPRRALTGDETWALVVDGVIPADIVAAEAADRAHWEAHVTEREAAEARAAAASVAAAWNGRRVARAEVAQFQPPPATAEANVWAIRRGGGAWNFTQSPQPPQAWDEDETFLVLDSPPAGGGSPKWAQGSR